MRPLWIKFTDLSNQRKFLLAFSKNLQKTQQNLIKKPNRTLFDMYNTAVDLWSFNPVFIKIPQGPVFNRTRCFVEILYIVDQIDLTYKG